MSHFPVPRIKSFHVNYKYTWIWDPFRDGFFHTVKPHAYLYPLMHLCFAAACEGLNSSFTMKKPKEPSVGSQSLNRLTPVSRWRNSRFQLPDFEFNQSRAMKHRYKHGHVDTCNIQNIGCNMSVCWCRHCRTRQKTGVSMFYRSRVLEFELQCRKKKFFLERGHCV